MHFRNLFLYALVAVPLHVLATPSVTCNGATYGACGEVLSVSYTAYDNSGISQVGNTGYTYRGNCYGPPYNGEVYTTPGHAGEPCTTSATYGSCSPGGFYYVTCTGFTNYPRPDCPLTAGSSVPVAPFWVPNAVNTAYNLTNNGTASLSVSVIGPNGQIIFSAPPIAPGGTATFTGYPAGSYLSYAPSLTATNSVPDGNTVWDPLTANPSVSTGENSVTNWVVSGSPPAPVPPSFDGQVQTSAPPVTINGGLITASASNIVAAINSGSGSSGGGTSAWTNGLTSGQYVADTIFLQTNASVTTNAIQTFVSGYTNLSATLAGNAGSTYTGLTNTIGLIDLAAESNVVNSYTSGNAPFDSNTVGAFLTISSPVYAGATQTGYMNFDINFRHSQWWIDLALITRLVLSFILGWEFLWMAFYDVDSAVRLAFTVDASRGNSNVIASPLGIGVQSSAPSAAFNGIAITLAILSLPLLFALALTVFGGTGFLSVFGVSPMGLMESLVSDVSPFTAPWVEFALVTLCDVIPVFFLLFLVVEYCLWSVGKNVALYVVCAIIKLCVA